MEWRRFEFFCFCIGTTFSSIGLLAAFIEAVVKELGK